MLDPQAGATGNYFLIGNGSLFANNGESIGGYGVAVFTQTGGENSTDGLQMEPGPTGQATYNLEGGTLNSVSDPEEIGGGGAATFNQTGGTNTLGAGSGLWLGLNGGGGSYLLSGNGSLVSPVEQVGYNGDGTFNQSGGTNAIGTELDLGSSAGSTGNYILGGGSLSARNIYVGGSSFFGAGGTGTLTVSGTGQLTVDGVLTVYPTGKVNIDGGTSTVGGLSIAVGGIVNINSALFINYGSHPDPIASIVAWIESGFANGAWDGPGIMSTNAQTNGGSYGIGYADSADPGNPANLPSGTIEIMYTLLGDANLDGAVNGTDFAILATNFNKGGLSWDQGDFNYDGSDNGTDFADLAANFNKGASQADVAALDSFASANGFLADVPEPASAVMLAMAGWGVLGRRRRCSKLADPK